jgi:hypothetical protein
MLFTTLLAVDRLSRPRPLSGHPPFALRPCGPSPSAATSTSGRAADQTPGVQVTTLTVAIADNRDDDRLPPDVCAEV